ncbi:tetratricopeptide repeat protein [uncultured Thiodictyon sp.]|uniref:tetratricopeptide repeat protein n=1 Tax=uncultured Thiodictyon sp. TaxID=1846217 RepID=UPI0025F25813|nr:tetratricopeptide repeat protein [uncultured Thiodictyon sp.]
MAHYNKGLTLQTQGTPAALAAAVGAYDEAIRLGQGLDLSVAQYRNDLAMAHMNKGNALQAQGTPATLAAAVAAYDEAIRLRQELDLGVAEYRNGLAMAHMNKGNALSDQGTAATLAAAVEACDEAIGLATARPGEELWLERADTEAKAYGNKAITLSQQGDPMSAADTAHEGLGRLRDLERAGVHLLRGLRERLFDLTLKYYLAARQPQFIAEIIREHLDPAEPGSAPASTAMHWAAQEALREAMALLVETGLAAEGIAGLVLMMQRLTDWRLLYFGGTAESARLQAADLETRGDPAQAEAMLRDYVAACPSDPAGYLVLAEFQVRREAASAAVESYQRAAAVLVQQAPVAADRADIAQRVAKVAGLMLKLELIDLGFAPSSDMDIEALLRRSDTLQRLLDVTFVNGLFEDAAGNPARGLDLAATNDWRKWLEPELKAVWEPFAAQRLATLKQWNAAATDQARTEERTKAWEDLKSLSRTMASHLVQGLPIRWQGFGEALIHAWVEVQRQYAADWASADAGRREDIEAKIAAALNRAVADASQAVCDGELAAARLQLQALLDPVWTQVLGAQEQRFLACGLHCLEHEWLSRYAGLNLGLALERTLVEQVFQPLRQDWRTGTDVGKDRMGAQVAAFLDGKRDHLMLGPMAITLKRALHHGAGTVDPIERLLLNRFGAHLLRSASEVRQRRGKALNAMLDLRNHCAHRPEAPSQAQVRGMWENLVEDPADAFYQYFGRALLPAA